MPRILLVDDDDAFRVVLRITLVKLGYEVTEAANGGEAGPQPAPAPADLLLTDIVMPDQEGLETIQFFHRKHPLVKIVAMSGGGRIDARDFLRVAKMMGAARTFTKPFSSQDLAAALAELLPGDD